MKIHKIRWLVVAVLIMVFFRGTAVHDAEAAAILLSEDREISASGTLDDERLSAFAEPPTPFASFNQNLSESVTVFVGDDPEDPDNPLSVDLSADLSQNSEITPSHITAAGSVRNELFGFSRAIFGGDITYNALSSSDLSVTFDLLEPHRYELEATLSEAGTGGFIFFSFSQEEPFEEIVRRRTSGDFVQSGILDPGTYDLRAVAQASISGPNPFFVLDSTADFDFDLRLHAVPETSSTFGLFLCAFIGLEGFRRVSVGNGH